MNADNVRNILERDKSRVNKTVDGSALANGLTAVIKQYYASVSSVDCAITPNRDGSVSITFKAAAEGIKIK